MNPEPSAELAHPSGSQPESLGHGIGLLATSTARAIRRFRGERLRNQSQSSRRGCFGRSGMATSHNIKFEPPVRSG